MAIFGIKKKRKEMIKKTKNLPRQVPARSVTLRSPARSVTLRILARRLKKEHKKIEKEGKEEGSKKKKKIKKLAFKKEKFKEKGIKKPAFERFIKSKEKRIKKPAFERFIKSKEKGIKKPFFKKERRKVEDGSRRLYQYLFFIGAGLTLIFALYYALVIMTISFVVTIFSYFMLSKSKKKPISKSRLISNLIKSKKWYETDIDKFIEAINKCGKISLSDAASGLDISEEKAEDWGKILEKNELIKIHYPIGKEMVFLRKDYKIAQLDMRLIFLSIFKHISVMVAVIALFIMLVLVKKYLLG